MHVTIHTVQGSTDVCVHGRLEPNSTTFVLLHGNSTSSHVWTNVMESMIGHKSVIALDCIDHGDSSEWRNGTDHVPTAQNQIDVFVAVLRALSVCECILVGHSMGGHLAIRLAEALEEQTSIRIKGLAVFGTPPLGLDGPPPFCPSSPEVEALVPLLTSLSKFTESEAEAFTHHQGLPSEPFVPLARRVTVGRNIAKTLLETPHDEAGVILCAKYRVLIAHASNDGAINWDYIRQFDAVADVCRIPDASHAVMWSQSLWVSEKLMSYFE